MNWVGGKLHRHSKANANSVIKTQKQHFAKARLHVQTRTSAPSTLSFPVFNERIDRCDSATGATGNGRLHRPEIFNREDERQGRQLPLEVEPRVRKCKHPDADPHNDRALYGSNTSAPAQRSTKHHRQSYNAGVNTIDDVKRDLLSRSDWTGLSATRPVKIHFALPADMAKIGRRRKITSEDRRRREHARSGVQARQKTIQPFVPYRAGLVSSVLDIENASIRIGSNIHQTQTSRRSGLREQLPAAVAESLSSESMLLDRLEEQNSVMSDPCIEYSRFEEDSSVLILHQCEGVAPTDSPEQPSTLSLDKVRDLDSFDKVKERSSSIAQHTPSISEERRRGERESSENLYLETHLQRKRAASGSVLRGYEALPSSDCGRQEVAVSDPSQPTSPSYGNLIMHCQNEIHSDGPASRGHNIRPIGQRKPLSTNSETRRSFVTPQRPLPQEYLPSTPAAVRADVFDPESDSMEIDAIHRPLFTLERQALLETGVFINQHSIPRTGEWNSSGDFVLGKPHQASQPVQFPASTSYEVGERHIGPPSTSFPMGPPALKCIIVQSPKLANRLPGANSAHRQESANAIRRSPCSDGGPGSPCPAGSDFSLARSAMAKASKGFQDSASVARRRGEGNVSDENESWMRFVFAKDFETIQRGFEFGPSKSQHAKGQLYQRASLHPQSSQDEGSLLEQLSWNTSGEGATSPTMSFQTSANTTLYQARHFLSSQPDAMLPSETDFLSQMSPMEGCLDDRIADISTYNNPARTMRSFPEVPGSTRDATSQVGSRFDLNKASSTMSYFRKRSAQAAFGNQTSLWVLPNMGNQSHHGLSSSHRQPLQVVGKPAIDNPCQVVPQSNAAFNLLSQSRQPQPFPGKV